MTYSETQGEKRFDWFAELAKQQQDAAPPSEELRDRAARWTTCACGNLCDRIPRDRHGRPVDDELQELGYRFGWHVCDGEWDSAIELLCKIEQRSAEVLAELNRRSPGS